jgi:hypothetical protein
MATSNGKPIRRGTKVHLYEAAYERQGGLCVFCEQPLPEDPAESHLDRIEEGGAYDEENTRLVHTACHRERHHNEAQARFPELRKAYDNYRFWVATKASLDLKARRAAEAWWADEVTLRELGRLAETAGEHLKYFTKQVAHALKAVDHPMRDALLSVHGVGPVTAAMLLARVDPAKAAYASSLWKFFGYAGPVADRYEKGVKGGGSPQDRSVLYNWAQTQVKLRTQYRKLYDDRRVKTDADPKWRSNAHRHMDACRVMIKIFLSHVWEVYRRLDALPVPDPYALAALGHEHYLSPMEFGWEAQAV